MFLSRGFLPDRASGKPASASRWLACAVAMAGLLHVVVLLVLVQMNFQTSRMGGSAGSSLRVSLVARSPRSIPSQAPPARPLPSAPVLRRSAPVLASHRPSVRQVSHSETVRTAPAQPVTQQPVQPATQQQVSPPMSSAVASAAVQPALELPDPQTPRAVAGVSCDIPQPPFPAKARRLGHEGRVVAYVTIDPTGRITEVEVTRSSGFEELDASARQAMLGGHCEPYVANGKSMTVRAEQPLDFRLN